MDGLIGTGALICAGVLHPAQRLTFQDDPGVPALLEVVSDLHPTTRRTAVLSTKLDLRMSLIAGDRNAPHVHVHRAHVESADRSQVLKNPGADGVAVIRLFLTCAQGEECDS